MKNSSTLSPADYLRKWGHAASIGLLDPAVQFFSVPSIVGAIGYRTGPKCAIVFGDPLCAHEDMPGLLQEFHNFCKQQRRSIVYVATSERLLPWTIGSTCRIALEVGNEVIIDPSEDPLTCSGPSSVVLRNKHRQAVRDGITVKEYSGNDIDLEKKLEAVGAEWLKGRRGLQVYLADVNIFANRAHRRWFYAEQNGNVIGILTLSRLDAYQGWVINFSMIVPGAPKHTSEFMLINVFNILRQEGCRFFSVGIFAAAQLGKIEGFGRVSKWAIRHVYSMLKKIFRLKDHYRFWKKFNQKQKPAFILFSRSRIGMRDVIGLLRALNVKIRVRKKPTPAPQPSPDFPAPLSQSQSAPETDPS